MEFYSAWYGFRNGKLVINFVTKDGVITKDSDLRPYAFIDARHGLTLQQRVRDKKICANIKVSPVPYKFIFNNSIPLSKVEVDHPKQIKTIRDKFRDIVFFEADIPYVRRYMIDKNLQVSTDYKKIYWDIEVFQEPGQLGIQKTLDGLLPIVSIATVDDKDEKKAFVGSHYLKKGDLKQLSKDELLEDERELLTNFFVYLQNNRYNLLLGWNTEEFDVPVMWKRMEYHREVPILCNVQHQAFRFLDVYVCFKKTRSGKWESWKLDDVAKRIFGGSKLFKLSEKSLLSLTPDEMQMYNIQDSQLVRYIDCLEPYFDGTELIPEDKVKEILAKLETRLTDYYVELAAFSHIFPDETTQATKVADGLLLEKARKHKYVLPNKPDIKVEVIPIKGARVIDPVAGVHEWVANLDFSSLYPNIIIFWKISPDVEGAIYPELLKELIAKRKQNKKLFEETKMAVYNTRQQALKILANALYGAFIYPKFRLFDRTKGEQVTMHGRELITVVQLFVEQTLGFKVTYGDTDSLFVKLKDDVKENLIQNVEDMADMITFHLRDKFGDDFQIVMEPQKIYERILFTEKKKKYFGKVVFEKKQKWKDVDFYDIVGFESKRSDWSAVAKRVQQIIAKMKLYREEDKAYEFFSNLSIDLFLGKLDNDLILSKTVTKEISKYIHKPPHVRAYIELLNQGITLEGGKVLYVITMDGPKPLVEGKFPDIPLDYAWYWNKQIVPIAERLGFQLEEKGVKKRQIKGDFSLDRWMHGDEDKTE